MVHIEQNITCEVQFCYFTPDKVLEDVDLQNGCSIYFIINYPLHVVGVTCKMYSHLFSVM